MRRTRPFIAVLAATASLTVALGAGTAAAGDTSTSFTVAVNSSGLSITHAATSSTLSGATFSAAAGEVSGTLPATTVTDERGALLGQWTVQVSGTDFTHAADSTVGVARANARVFLDAVDLTALTTTLAAGTLEGMTVTGAELTAGTNNLSSTYTLIQGTTDTGTGKVTYVPAMKVTLPANTPAGTYTATVTQTVS